MSDLTHDAQLQDDGFHEIQLGGKQLIFVFMVAVALSIAIFLCGVKVGQSIHGGSADTTEAVNTSAGTSADVPSASQPAPSATPASGPPAAEPPAPANEADDELSYAKRLQSDAPPKEQLKPADDAAAKPAADAKAAPQKPAPAAAAAAPASTAASPAARPGVWVVQLVALKDRGAAQSIVQRLSGKGYPAFLVSPSPGAPPIYRVQVGRYAERRDAEQAARKLEKEEERFRPWIDHAR